MNRFRMKPFHKTLILLAAPMGLGLSMPSCPGQDAIQQQMDSIQAKGIESEKKVQALSAQVASMDKDLTEARTLLAQVSQTVLEQKATLEQMSAGMKDLSEKVERSGKTAAGGKKKK